MFIMEWLRKIFDPTYRQKKENDKRFADIMTVNKSIMNDYK